MANKRLSLVMARQSSYVVRRLVSSLNWSTKTHIIASLFLVNLVTIGSTQAQVGEVIWEDNFDTFDEDVWTPDHGNGCSQGLCGFGNQEKQSYEPENVSIQPVPGEPGNNALALQAKREYIEHMDARHVDLTLA